MVRRNLLEEDKSGTCVNVKRLTYTHHVVGVANFATHTSC